MIGEGGGIESRQQQLVATLGHNTDIKWPYIFLFQQCYIRTDIFRYIQYTDSLQQQLITTISHSTDRTRPPELCVSTYFVCNLDHH